MQRQLPCRVCYTCQVCVSCEVYGEFGRREGEPAPPVETPFQVERPISPAPMPRPQPQFMQQPIPPLTEERVREIVFEILTQLGLVKPPQRRIQT